MPGILPALGGGNELGAPAMTVVELLSGAWCGDEPLALSFPDDWQVTVVEATHSPALSDAEIARRIAEPVRSPRLSALAAGKRRPVILVDDLMRPTPAAHILPPILAELAAAGIDRGAITVVVASGAHAKPTREDALKKVGPSLFHEMKVVCHDCHHDLVHLGKTTAGKPIYLNRHVAESDLKIGVGGIYPHLEAGFSGGAKLLAPGACGIETVRALHEFYRGDGRAGGLIDNDFRAEINAIARRVGLDFLVSARVNRERQVTALFAGDWAEAFRAAVDDASSRIATRRIEGADVVIADAYPFDTTLQFAVARGFWPIAAHPSASRILIAACPMGLGTHQLFPLTRPVWKRALGRLARLTPAQLGRLAQRGRSMQRTMSRRRVPLMLLSSGIEPGTVARVFPNATLFRSWPPLLEMLESRHRGEVRVAVYRCAPLQSPTVD